MDDHTDAIIGILTKAARDADYAAGQAVDELSHTIRTSDHAREALPRIQKTSCSSVSAEAHV